MKKQIIKYDYEGQDVEFDLTTQRVWVNATQMAKICKKKMNDYLELQSTKEFTKELVKELNKLLSQKISRDGDLEEKDSYNLSESGLGDGNSRRQEVEAIPILTEKDVIKIYKGGRRQGTWMDRVQALHFAAWLDAKFAVWVFLTIDKILFEQQDEEETKLSQAALNEIRRQELEKEFAEDPKYIELQRLRGYRSQYLKEPTQQAAARLEHFITNNANTQLSILFPEKQDDTQTTK